MATYICRECGEIFEQKFICAIHFLEIGHKKFNVSGTDIEMIIKSV